MSSLCIVVIEDEKCGPAHVIDVVVYNTCKGILKIVVDLHEKFTIILDHRPSLFSQIICPLIGAVRIVTVIKFASPGVSDLDKFYYRVVSYVGDLPCAQDGVGVAQSKANFILIIVVAALSSHLEDVASRFGSRQLLPDYIRFSSGVHYVLFGGTVKGSH